MVIGDFALASPPSEKGGRPMSLFTIYIFTASERSGPGGIANFGFGITG
jgi:hypothetical protein